MRIERRLYKDGTLDPKSETSTRTVPVAPTLRSELKKRRGGAADSALVFTNGRGAQLDYWTAEGIFKAAAQRAGVEGATMHLCRHTLASWLLPEPPRGLALSPKQAQTWLGHHRAAFTLDYCAHFMPEDLPDASSAASG